MDKFYCPKCVCSRYSNLLWLWFGRESFTNIFLQNITAFINQEGVFITAPTTLGLLNSSTVKQHYCRSIIFALFKFLWYSCYICNIINERKWTIWNNIFNQHQPLFIFHGYNHWQRFLMEFNNRLQGRI